MIIYLFVGALSGLLSGLLGLGGGIIVVPALSFVFLYFHIIPQAYVMHFAVGTSLAAMIVTTASSLIAHAKRKRVRLDILKKILPGLISGAILGAFLAGLFSSKILHLIFGLFLLTISLHLIIGGKSNLSGRQLSNHFILIISFFIGILCSLLGIGCLYFSASRSANRSRDFNFFI